MAEIQDLNIADAGNTARWPEGMAPSAVNNAGRADEGLLARWHKDTNASKASTGSANAYVFAADQTLSAYYDGLEIGFDANFENTGAATLNVDAVAAATIKKNNDQDLIAGDIEAGQKVIVIHDGTNWQMQTPTARGGSPITTRGDIARGDTNGDAERLALGTAKFVPTSDGTDVAYAEVPLARGAIDGLTLSNNATDATNDIDIAVGVTRETADTVNLAVTSAIGKQLDVSWATGGTPGTPTGGLSSSLTLTNDTWYHAIAGKVSGTVEVGFDTSITGANLVTDHSFTNTRRIGSVRRGTAANALFLQWGDRFFWDEPISEPTVTGDSTNTLTRTPLGVRVLARVSVEGRSQNSSEATGFGVFLRPLDFVATVVAPVDSDPSQTNLGSYQQGSGVNNQQTGVIAPIDVLTDTNQQVRLDVVASMTTIDMSVHGYKDLRGRHG